MNLQSGLDRETSWEVCSGGGRPACGEKNNHKALKFCFVCCCCFRSVEVVVEHLQLKKFSNASLSCKKIKMITWYDDDHYKNNNDNKDNYDRTNPLNPEVILIDLVLPNEQELIKCLTIN